MRDTHAWAPGLAPLALLTSLALLTAIGGCRSAARIKEVPRVDLEVEGSGNRGYLVGTPPAAGPMQRTREIIQMDVEIPSFYKPKPTAPVALEQSAPLESAIPSAFDMDATPDESSAPWQSPTQYDSYTVQKGDSLWSIAAKPEIYGKATQWRRIFDANRDLLNSPDKLKPGMSLRIPRGESEAGESVTYKK